MVSNGEPLREQLAAIEHERWAHWQRWMHDQGRRARPDGTGALVLPAVLVDRWERQIATTYADLTEAEKASDREQVDRYWPLIEPLLAEVERVRTEVERALGMISELSRELVNSGAEVESLRRQVAEQRQLANDLADERLGPALAESARLAGRERDVIEAAKAWRAARVNWTSTGAADGRAVNASIERLCVAVDALSQPVAKAADHD